MPVHRLLSIWRARWHYLTNLCCRECGKRFPNGPLSSCDECFSSLEVAYDMAAAKKTFTREAIARGPQSMWRYQALLPVPEDYVPTTPSGMTPLMAAPRLAKRIGATNLYLKNDAVCLPTLSFQGSGRLGRPGHREELRL